MNCSTVPFKLAETWFWMAFSSKENALNNAGFKKIKEHFGGIDNAVEAYPELDKFNWKM